MVSILKKATLLLLAVFALVSCQEKGSPDIEYIPFKREYNDNWGLIGIDGKILFENKYSSCPSPSYNGVFMLKGEDGYEFYTTEEEPKKVAGPFKRACPFTDVVTPVLTKDGDLQIIDRKGKVVKVVNEIDGKKVRYIYNFEHGKAPFELKGGGCGFLDTDGDVFLSPGFGFKARVLDNGNLEVIKNGDKGYMTVVFDSNGDVIDSLQSTSKAGLFDGKYFVTDGYSSNGVLDVHGNEIIPSERSRTVVDMLYDHFVLKGWMEMSLVNNQGETLLKSDYWGIKIVDKDRLLVGLNGQGAALTDYTGKELTDPIFRIDPMSRYYNGKVMPVQRDDFRWVFIDKEGKPISDESYKILDFYNEPYHRKVFFVYPD